MCVPGTEDVLFFLACSTVRNVCIVPVHILKGISLQEGVFPMCVCSGVCVRGPH